jgi:Uncharacterized conserved protein (DUF2278)
MPVQDYGVVIGQFDHFDRDDANHFGSFFHGHIFVRVGSGAQTVLYNCAVDVKFPTGMVEYLEPSRLDATRFANVPALADGFHSLASTPSSGALDYVRNPLISRPLGSNNQVWKQNVGMSALMDLEAFLGPDGGIRRIYVFGAHFLNSAQNPPQGMHDVHMNQGDPPGSFQHLDGIWQDGGVVVEQSGGNLAGFFVKFVSQTLKTNEQGLPA